MSYISRLRMLAALSAKRVVLSAVGVLVLSVSFIGWPTISAEGSDIDEAHSPSSGLGVSFSRVGFVDIPYLIDKAPQALEAEQRLEAEFAPRQEELEAQRSDLSLLSRRLADARSNELTEAEIAQLDRESRSLERRIRRSEQDFREELNIQKNNEFKKVRILVLEAIAQFGEQNDYDLIVSDGVLFANQRIDVTERILDSLMHEFLRLQSAN